MLRNTEQLAKPLFQEPGLLAKTDECYLQRRLMVHCGAVLFHKLWYEFLWESGSLNRHQSVPEGYS